ncbi:chromosome segregation protein SMC [Algivirga pacifica]|uniref:Chromosome segregation protein SMC n=1 Tax=Algivirga pacifica TaxID=1162670 RepID=A0ABP9DPC2_9BACT
MTLSKIKRNNKNNLLLVLVVILVFLNGLQWLLNDRSSQKKQVLIESKELELVTTYAKLDSISSELELQISELQSMNGHVDSLILIVKELERDKQELLTSKNLANGRYQELRGKVEAYEELLKRKDAEIALLKKTNQSLLDETISLKKEKIDLEDSIVGLKRTQRKMSAKISMASSLKAKDLSFTRISDSGKEKIGTSFKNRRLSRLKLHFTIAKNPISPIGVKTIYLIIATPEGATLYNEAIGSGTFKLNKGEVFYTMKQDILFDNTEQKVAFEYTKDSDLKVGQYTAMLYNDGVLMGEQSFIIK